MRLGTIVVGALLVGSTFLVTRAVYSGEEATGPSKEEQEKMMAEVMKLATPGPEHAEMAKYAGTWDTETTDCSDPSKPKTKGSMTSRTVLGGRFLLSEYKGEMMGMPFEGLAIEGFDNKKKEWFSVWFDVWSTGNMRSTGGAIKDGVRTLVSETCDWGMGPTKMRLVEHRKDADNMTLEMYATDASGKETKGGDITFTRKK